MCTGHPLLLPERAIKASLVASVPLASLPCIHCSTCCGTRHSSQWIFCGNRPLSSRRRMCIQQ